MFSTLLLSAVGVLSVLPSVRGTNSCSSSLTAAVVVDASTFSTTTYDYVIVGGGTAGLALAARLSQVTSIKVGVIEAGVYHKGDTLLETPGNSLPGGQGNPSYDWLFETTPQAGANGRSLAAPRGKMMGGSSGLNLMGWNRASKLEYDVWSTFSGSSSWSWAGLTQYFSKSQTVKQGQANPFPGVNPAQNAASFTHGSVNGPINVSYNEVYSDIVPSYVKAWNNLGISTNSDADSGSTIGIYNSRMSIDRGHGIRSYAANGYFAQSCSRSNLHTITGAQATKVLFKRTYAGYVATGVTYTVGAKSYTVNANKEVILSAGSVKTPQLLELSGIGNSTLLKSVGITPMINLPQVGENMQEHVFSIVEFELNEGHQTFDELNNNATFLAQQTALYASNHTGWLAANDGALGFATFQQTASVADQASLLAAFDAQVSGCSLTPIQKLQYKIQRDWIVKGTVPMTESIMFSRGLIAPQAGQSYLTLLSGAQHPMARGSIHINSADPTAAPVINGNYLNNDFDVKTILQGIKFLLKLGKTAPLSEIIKGVVEPTVTSDADLIQWIRNTLSTGSHILGTAALATQAQGGVVDSNLIVYGTTNLRIVDASIMPFTIATHLQSTVYAIAEKAADMILG
ncbi:alcohol oxidase [Mycena epipterygia]|nr:alcohol oxidase [Mycena epipterygia]